MLTYSLPARLALIVIGGLLAIVTGCEKKDNGPSAADYARCAHIDRSDTVWGEYLYDVCLRHPWPTELPPATQEGLSTFGGIINDTLLFVAGSPRAFPDETAFCATVDHGEHRRLRAGRGTWDEIDPRSLGLNIAVYSSDSFATTTFSRLNIQRFGPLSGQYEIDVSRSVVRFTRWDDEVVAGTIDAWFVDESDPTRQVHLSEGRFDFTVRPQ